MRIDLVLNNRKYQIDLMSGIDISQAINFNALDGGDDELTAFSAPPATSTPFIMGDFIGDMRKGGSCNCETYNLTPHVHGTHTECVGHITEDRISIYDIFQGGFMMSRVISPQLVMARDNDEKYGASLKPNDRIITEVELKKKLDGCDDMSALIIRTSLDTESSEYPPFFTHDAMSYIASLDMDIQHLLIDTPSVDRIDDGGELKNHHIFWNVDKTQKNVHIKHRSLKTITEIIHVPSDLSDGLYGLNLQIAPMVADAAPSRPILYKVNEE